MTTLNCSDIRQTMQSGATLLDVRNAAEFNLGALPDAKNIPLANLGFTNVTNIGGIQQYQHCC